MSIGEVSGRWKASVAAAAMMGLSVAGIPAAGKAQTAEACSASVQRGAMPSLTSKGKGSRTIYSPLLERGKHLALVVPDSYVEKVAGAAKAKPASEQRPFVAEVIQRNVQLALAKVGSAGRASFDCAPLTDTFQGATASPSAAPAKTSGQAARYASDEIAGGDGSKGSPFAVRLRKNRSSANDISGQEIEIPMNFQVGSTVYFKVSVTLSQLGNSKISETYGEIVRIARLQISAMPEQRGGAVRLTSNLPGFKAGIRDTLSSMKRTDIIEYIDSH
ncbi:MAG: hypothetical protein AB1324_04320 [Candidatus Micrarchaeota archaeon]